MMNSLLPVPRARLSAQRGLSLVELMVGITIGLLVVAGLVTLFANSSGATNELEKSIRQFENGRYATDLLNEDLNHAGFYADVLSTAGTPTYVVAGPCATAIADLGWAPSTGTGTATIPATIPAAIAGLTTAEVDALPCLPNHKANTPALAIHRLDTNAVAPGDATAGSAYVQSSRCGTSTATFVIATAVAGSGTATFPFQNSDCTTPATVRRHVARVYYIATCNECGIDTVPTLKRAELVGNVVTVTPMVEGIDDIAFDFGFDTQNATGDITKFDGVPDEYRAGLSGTVGANNNDWKNVVSVRIHLLSRTTEPTAGYTEDKTYAMGLAGTRGPFTDRFKRRAYVITTRLNNVSGMREGS